MTLQTDLLTVLPELIMAGGAMALLLWGALSAGGSRSANPVSAGGSRSVNSISAGASRSANPISAGGSRSGNSISEGAGRSASPIREETAPLISWGAIALMVIAGVVLVVWTPHHATAFHSAFIADNFARFAQILILVGAIFSVLLADEFFQFAAARFELPVLMTLAALGMMLMVSAGSLVALYLGMELQSLALYVLAAFNRDHIRSSEAGLKYFVLGSLASGMMLYGISLIYGFTGSVEFIRIAQVAGQTGIGIGLIFGIVFLISGLAFKVSAVPFHMWTPDVYEGAPTPITTYIATSSKVAAMALFLRAILTSFPHALEEWRQIIVAISILSMVLGTVGALGQKNIKRLMAYSTISHMGYMLLGLAAGTAVGARGVLVYLTIYVFTNLGIFACIQAMRRDGKQIETMSDLAGLARTDPKLALIFSLSFLSLSGLPPLAGFFAKWYIFTAAIQAHLYWPAILGVLASVIGLAYYLRLVKIMYFDEPAPAFDRGLALGSKVVLVLSGIVTVFFIVAASPVISSADAAAKVLLP